MSKLLRALILGALVASSTSAVSQEAQSGAVQAPKMAVPTKEQLERKLENVRTLLTSSSAAKQIEASGNDDAKAKRQEALAMHAKAEKELAKGNLAEANRLLGEAPKLLFLAARGAAPEQIVGDKQKRDYENRLSSVQELLSAQKRIGAEKQAADMKQTTESIETLVARAEEIAKTGKYVDAKQVLDQAYLYAKTAVTSMRAGDTLVRSLNFATKAEEYAYELDRNDTHHLLLKVLVEEQGKTLPQFAEKFLTAAGDLRKAAEEAAQKGNHEEGVKLLEESTGNLAKAIRSAGIFIPG